MSSTRRPEFVANAARPVRLILNTPATNPTAGLRPLRNPSPRVVAAPGSLPSPSAGARMVPLCRVASKDDLKCAPNARRSPASSYNTETPAHRCAINP